MKNTRVKKRNPTEEEYPMLYYMRGGKDGNDITIRSLAFNAAGER